MYECIRILLIWLLCLWSVLLHELGHAAGYRISTGKADWKVIVGSGPRIFGISKYTFCLIPAGGYFNPEEEPETKKAEIITFAGGPLASLLQAALYGVVRFCILKYVQPASGLLEMLVSVATFPLYYNFFQFLFTIIPMRYRIVCRGFESDGMQILHLLKQKER